jgi:N-acetylglucosamine-6-sulfatase
LDKYLREPFPWRPNVMEDEEIKGKPAFTRPNIPLRRDHATRAADEWIGRSQLRCLASVDEGVGKILKALEASGQLDNTFLVFSSDNGFMWHEHGLGNKGAAYEESIRDPLLIRYPPMIKPGTQLPQIVLNIDLAPTLLELGGVPVPQGLHGRSLLPLLRGDTTGWRQSALFEYWQLQNWQRIPTWQAVRTGEWKYIHYPDLPGTDELYNLKADPYELKNVINDAAAKPVLEQRTAELNQLLNETR